MLSRIRILSFILVLCMFIALPVKSDPALKFKFSKKDKALAHYNIAVNFAKRGELEKAIKSFSLSADLDPDNFDVYYNMGVAYSMMNEMEAAMKAYQIALTKNPKHAATYYNLAVIQAEKKDLDSARGNYIKAIEYNPDMLEAHANLALIYLYKNEQEKFQQELAILEKLDPATATKVKNIAQPPATN